MCYFLCMANTVIKNRLRIILYNQDFPGSTSLREERMQMWAEGIKDFGDRVEMVSGDPLQFGDVCITWGPRTVERAHQKALHHLVMECGFLGDRLDNFFVGFSGLNGMGRCPIPVRKGAGEQWYPLIAPRRDRDEHRNVAIFGQVAKDASLIPLCADDMKRPEAYARYLQSVADHFERQGLAVGFRGHPMDPVWTDQVRPAVFSFDHEKWDKDRIMEWADIAFAFSSNALVEALLAGVDVLPAHPTSLCWDVRSAIDAQNRLSMDDMRAWVDMLASNQWSSAQIRSGEAWASIRPYFARSCKSA
jgi:hypothetical protein